MSRFLFFLYNCRQPIDSGHWLWDRFLPVSRRHSTLLKPVGFGLSITYGHYFETMAMLLTRGDFKLLLEAVNRRTGHPVSIDKISRISICLEKHGAFYHSSRLEVEVHCGKQLLDFVINVAFSEAGRDCMREEVAVLTQLVDSTSLCFLPKVYAFCADESLLKYRVSVFLGEWFAEFHEFHLSLNQGAGGKEVAIWNNSDKNLLLSEAQIKELYFQISMILSFYYDPISTRQIFPWHNASGDFVVKIDKGRVDVRLVTARGFSPMIKGADTEDLSTEESLYALMMFLLHLSIRVRLDRLDGVGPVVLADTMYVPSILAGFFRGLNLVAGNDNFPKFFKDYILSYRVEKLLTLTSEINSKIYKKRGDEFLVISRALDRHVGCLYHSLRELNLCTVA